MRYHVYMYVAVVPNRNSPPAILLRESYREHGKVRNRTLKNLSDWPAEKIDALRRLLKGSAGLVPVADSFDIVRSLPHGHVAAVIGSLRKLGLDALIDAPPSRQRDLVVAMIAARILDPGSKLATARALHAETLTSSLGELLHLDDAQEDELYRAMDWLLGRQPRIEQGLAQRHLAEGGVVLYDLTSTYFEGRHCELARLGHSRDDKSGHAGDVRGHRGAVLAHRAAPVAVVPGHRARLGVWAQPPPARGHQRSGQASVCARVSATAPPKPPAVWASSAVSTAPVLRAEATMVMVSSGFTTVALMTSASIPCFSNFAAAISAW